MMRAMRPDDFPFQPGQPAALKAIEWAFVMAALAAATALLMMPPPGLRDGWGRFVPALLFPAMPLLALRAVAGPQWTALFRRLRWRDLGIAAGVVVLNLVVTVLVALAVEQLYGANANPVFDLLRRAGTSQVLEFFIQSIPQLLGEELLTVLPFLALLAVFRTRGPKAVIAAWVLSALPFALVHLPTYGGNLAQCLLVIGSARLVLMLAYLATRNVWVSTLAHIANDWLLFGAMLVLPE